MHDATHKTVVIAAALTLATSGLTSPSIHAGVIFTESFEEPVVSGQWVISGFNTDGPWPGWVGVNRYTGVLNNSVNEEGSERFVNPVGDQIAYVFNNRPSDDTGASLTTTPDSLDAVIAPDTIYTLTFQTASDRGAAIDYHVELLAIDDDADPAVETVLGQATGSLSSNDLSATSDRIVFTAVAGHPNLGERIAIRLLKGSGDWHFNVYYDNLRLEANDPLKPSPDDGETVPAGDVELSWTNLTPNVGEQVYVDVWFGGNPNSLTQLVDAGVNTTSVTVAAPVAGTYYWQVDSYLDGTPTGDPLEGRLFRFYVADTDGDGLPDDYELAHTSPPSPVALEPDDDLEPDGLTNLEEYLLGTEPDDPDTDGDTLHDGDEVHGAGARPATDPTDEDTDDDGLGDGVETGTGRFVSETDTGTDPTMVDSDVDGLGDGVETGTGRFVSETDTGTDPTAADSDDDGAGDWYEIAASFTDPTDSGDRPVIPYPLPAPDASPPDTTKPVKVYILSGQSNMVGMGNISGTRPGTLETIVERENKFPNLIDDAGDWTVRNDVTYKGVIAAVGQGPLTAGVQGRTIGPELGFGHVLGYLHDEPVLLLKTSQGNRSIGWDFLPPGSERFTEDGVTYAGYGDSPASWPEGTEPEPINWYAGKQYDDCVAAAHEVLDNFDTLFPQYSGQGYEIAGFVWWQGHKDAQSSVYARRYELNMARLIDALRSEFDAPNAPFVLATIGFGGWDMDMDSNYGRVHAAQMAMADPQRHPEFDGNVHAMDTRGYWRSVADSPVSQGHHYHRNAETFALVGDALGRGMVRLLGDSPPAGGPVFSRGDADADGSRNISDGVFLFNYLFGGGPQPPCKDAADTSDQGRIDISSGIYILNFLFGGGPPPPAPFPDCGRVEEPLMGCLSFPPCER